MQGNVKEQGKSCGGAEYSVVTWEQDRRQGMLYQGESRHMDPENM
jgi:hypothetical protein